ncbi:MAG: threonine synthase [Flavobacteriales bacterium]|nr:threonine synthase [Flavobacteriales bacterium]
MKYFSLNHKSPKTSFKQAVINGIAPDKGLYFPENIPQLEHDFFEKIENYSNQEIAFKVIKPFIENEIPDEKLKEIIAETLSFDFPTIKVNETTYSLELFHGPTMAFKDVGAYFMARCLGYFNHIDKSSHSTVLVATSGDTGGAVASGFLGVEGVQVVILYPSGKVSDIQEKQLTTLGQNINALEIDGVFDDCQDMVKIAFLDEDFRELNLTSANSINIARWLPQMFYYFFAYKQLKHLGKELVVSVPSGNFGNICAGMLAQKMGLPIKQFIASTNINDTVPNYLNTGNYELRNSKPTISNAMDVGNPSNFIRIKELFEQSFSDLKQGLKSYSFTDAQTKEAMKELYNEYDYIADPHGAVGYLGLEKYKSEEKTNSEVGVFLETAHPCKFIDVVESTLNLKVEIPHKIAEIIDKKKVSVKAKSYEDLKAFLLNK